MFPRSHRLAIAVMGSILVCLISYACLRLSVAIVQTSWVAIQPPLDSIPMFWRLRVGGLAGVFVSPLFYLCAARSVEMAQKGASACAIVAGALAVIQGVFFP